MDKTINNPPLLGSGGGNKSSLDLDHVDMKTMSQSELYNLSQCSSSAFDLTNTENVVIPTIISDHQSTTSTTTTTTTTRIFAFSHRRPQSRNRNISASEKDIITDLEMEENKLILSSLDKLVANQPQVVVAEVSKKKRKRKSKKELEEENNNNINMEDEFKGLSSIIVNGEEIDLRFLAVEADNAFKDKLKKMTENMVREDQLLGFMGSLEGRWGSSRRRRKYIDAGVFLKVLPANWKIYLSLKPRARKPFLYCRRFVSPSGNDYRNCTEVALHLKSEFVTNDANPPNEVGVMPIGNDRQETGPEAMAIVPISSFAAEDDVLLVQQPNPLPVIYLPYPVVENFVKQKSVVIKEELDPLPDTGMNQNVPRLIDANCLKSLSMPESSNGTQNTPDVTSCMWCLKDFSPAQVDAETLVNSSSYICPKCKDDISGRLVTTLAKMYSDADE